MSYETYDPKVHDTGHPIIQTEKFWVRESAYIVNEMLHAIEQNKNPELTEEQRKGYAKRAKYLRDKAVSCINNAYNESNEKENE